VAAYHALKAAAAPAAAREAHKQAMLRLVLAAVHRNARTPSRDTFGPAAATVPPTAPSSEDRPPA